MRASVGRYGLYMTPPSHEDHDAFGTSPSQMRQGAAAPSQAPSRTQDHTEGPDISSVLWGIGLAIVVVAIVVVVLILTGTFTR